MLAKTGGFILRHKKTELCLKLLFIVLLLNVNACGVQQNEVKLTSVQASPVNLTVGEGFNNPIGYYEMAPRFSCKLATKSDANAQSAYQILSN